jgi:hypothetical protein
MTKPNTTNNQPKPRLKRIFRRQIDLGPYLGTEKRNPVLYRNILDTSRFVDSMDVDKWILISGGNAMYHIVEPELRKISRPLAAISGHDENGSNKDAYWAPFPIEAGHGTEQLALWREQVLYVLEHKYCVYDQTEVVASLKSLYKELYGEVLTEEINY